MSDLIFILGSDDAEMRAIEGLLEGLRLPCYYAMGPRGRVRPGEVATGPILDTDSEIVAIEVGGPWGDPIIDHHGERPEASAPPAEFLRASSIGQVITLLARGGCDLGLLGWEPRQWPAAMTAWSGHMAIDELHPSQGQWLVYGPNTQWVIPPEIAAVAAADHCLAAAMQGRCPGAHPDVVAQVHVEHARMTYAPDRSAEEYRAEVEQTIATLKAAPACEALDPEGNVADLTHLEIDGPVVGATGEQYPSKAQHLPVAAALAGRGYVVRIRRRDGRLAMRVGGCGDGSIPGAAPIQRWLNRVGEAFGCAPVDAPRPDNLYGFPARGMGGGTLLDGGGE